MAMSKNELLDAAYESFRTRRAREALAILARLPGREGDGGAALLEGLIHEFGGEDLAINLGSALRHYRRAAVLVPDAAPPCLYIARVLMKTSDVHPDSIRRWLDEAACIRHDADVDLAFAAFYEEIGVIDLPKARIHFRRAACAGRYAGFLGVARILRKQGKRLKAFGVDFLRVLAAPFLLLLIGRRVTLSFNGYWR